MVFTGIVWWYDTMPARANLFFYPAGLLYIWGMTYEFEIDFVDIRELNFTTPEERKISLGNMVWDNEACIKFPGLTIIVMRRTLIDETFSFLIHHPNEDKFTRHLIRGLIGNERPTVSGVIVGFEETQIELTKILLTEFGEKIWGSIK